MATTEKRQQIIQGLLRDFPDGEASRQELMDWATNCGLSKYAPSFVWQSENSVRRGVFRIPTLDESGNLVTLARSMPKAPVVETPMVESPNISNVIEFPKTETESYVPSKVNGYVKFGHYNDIKTIAKSGQFYPIFITGLSGNGKTMMIEQVHAEIKKELFRVNITIETDEDDMIGHYALVDGRTVWQDGPVTMAMERGATLLLDEVDLASNKIMCLQPVLEGNPLLIKKEGRIVRPAPGFTVMATANTKGKGSEDGRFIGTNILNEAFLERFAITIEQPYPSAAIEKKIVVGAMNKYGSVDEDFATNLVTWSEVIRKTFFDGGVDEVISTRRLDHIVKAFAIFGDKMKAIELCVARFDEDTKASFLDLYTKIDAGIEVGGEKEDDMDEIITDDEPAF